MKEKKRAISAIVEETVRIAASLPDDKARALLDYASYLAARADEASWQEQFAAEKYQPKLKNKLAEIKQRIAAGEFKPLNPRSL